MPYDEWQGGNYTDQNKVRAWGASAICEPCLYAHAWVPPPGYVPTEAEIAKKAAKRAERQAAGEDTRDERTVMLRLFTHLWDSRGYVYANKAGKRVIRDWLRGRKVGAWFASVADSGQKHTLPWTPMNPTGSTRAVVRFEDRDVVLGDWQLVDDLTDLLTDGVTKDEFESGEFRRVSWEQSGEALLSFVERWRAVRGSDWWALALWLAQRDEDEHARRTNERREAKRAKAAHGRAAGGAAGRVPGRGRQPAQALGPAPGPSPDRGKDERERRTVGVGARQKPRTGSTHQGSLFGDDDAL